MARITAQNYQSYMKGSSRHIDTHTREMYLGDSPTVQAGYGTYDSKSTAHKVACWMFDLNDSATDATPCTSIPRGFTVAIEENNTVVEYQYKKNMPVNGYTADDLEIKASSNAGDIKYNPSTTYPNNTVGKAIRDTETDILNISEDIHNLKGDVGTISELETTEKENLVEAINEVKESVDEKIKSIKLRGEDTPIEPDPQGVVTIPPGYDAVFYRLIPSSTTITRDSSGTPRVNFVSCVVQKCVGEEVTTETPDNLYYSINGGNLVQGDFVSISKNDGIESIEFMLMPEVTGAIGMALGQATLDSPLTKVTISIIQEAANGESIPLRTSIWNNTAIYNGGNAGDVIQDIVAVEGDSDYMYLCKYTHSGVKPSPSTIATENWSAEKPWVATEYRDFTATKVLFVDRGTIENADIRNVTIKGTITEDCRTVNLSEPVTIVGDNVDENNLARSLSSYIVDTNEITTGHIIQLPTYNGYTEEGIDFCARAYKTAGTRLSIFTMPSTAVINWMEVEPAHDATHAEILDSILDHSVLVSADPLALFATIDNSVIQPKHQWVGGGNPYEYTYKHGRFSINGKLVRFIFLYPGQHLDLISSIQVIDDEPCLVWNVNNASDFELAGIRIGVDGTLLGEFTQAGYTLYEVDMSSKTHMISGGAYGLDGLVANLMPFDTRANSSAVDPLIVLDITLAGTCSATGLQTVVQNYPSWNKDVIS